ncbi:MAG: HDOD domain-containing protein [Thermodesulfobacteriota bacterium]
MNTAEKQRLLDEIAASDYLPSLSPLTVQLIGLAADEHSSILDLTRIIEQDPGLTARLLKIVNSAFYAHREPITAISYAVMVAGFDKIRMMALNISLKDTFPLGKINGMDYDYFWKTSLYRAIIAQDLVKGSYLTNLLDHEEVFTAGLILEIGLPLAFHLCPEELKDSFPGGDLPLEEILHWEEEHLGVNHRELGALTLRHWNFPDPFIEIQNNFGLTALLEQSADFPKIVEIARVCTQLFFGGGEEDFTLLKQISGWLKTGMDRVSDILSQAFFRVEEMARELRLQINPEQDRMEVMEKAGRVLAKINGSLEENLGKFSGLISARNLAAQPSAADLSTAQRKDLETALEAMAHEIRNPLTAIGGFAQRMVKKGQEQVDVVKYAELIVKESQRLEQVLNDMMNITDKGAASSTTRPKEK